MGWKHEEPKPQKNSWYRDFTISEDKKIFFGIVLLVVLIAFIELTIVECLYKQTIMPFILMGYSRLFYKYVKWGDF